MALPVSLSGLNVSVATVGPFKSSGGNYYLFGRDGTTATTLQAYKSTAPDTSWSSVATNTGFATAVNFIAGYQVGDTIHLAVIDGTSTSCNLKYRTFNMATDAFVTSETIRSAFNPTSGAFSPNYWASITYRATDSQPVIGYNGANAAIMSVNYSRIYYTRRTGVNTWTANVAIDVGGSANYQGLLAILGDSDAIHFVSNSASTTSFIRTLSSANTFPSAGFVNGTLGVSYGQAAAYPATTTIAIVGIDKILGASTLGVAYFTSAADPGLNVAAAPSPGSSTPGVYPPALMFTDNSVLYMLYPRDDQGDDLYVASSTDGGATWGSITLAMAATVARNTENLSRGGAVYQRGPNFVLPYVVNDGGTLKYNEYIVRTVALPWPSPLRPFNHNLMR